MNFLYAIAILIASYIISSLVAGRKKPTDARPATQDEFNFPQAEEGTPQAVVFGDCWVNSWMVLWHGNYRNSPIKTKGGKK